MKIRLLLGLAMAMGCIVGNGATANPRGASVSRVEKICRNGKPIERFKLTNKRGMQICVTNFAASLTDVLAPDRQGKLGHVVLGFDSIAPYLGKHPKFGAVVGRYANRIKNAELTLQGDTFRLEKNNGEHCLHGGSTGFNTRVFRTDTCYVRKDTAAVAFSYESPDGEGGFPGNLHVTVTYKLTGRNEIIIEYAATTDRATVVNFTNHSYFNLSGGTLPVTGYSYQINADSITQFGADLIPTGRLMEVAGTEYDFRSSRSVEQKVRTTGTGYDMNYQLRGRTGTLKLAAVVADSESGRVLKAYTTEPGMQFYIPHYDMGYLTGHDGVKYGKCWGFCLEMQHFPDSPHHPNFPSTVLRPGETYHQTTVYRFETLHGKK